MVLSLFWDSPKEGALTYTDWRREVEEYIRKGYDDSRIKDAMLSSVKGQAYINFRSCDEGRNRTLAQILKEMDSIYNISVTFRDLNAPDVWAETGNEGTYQDVLRENGRHQC